MLEEKNDNLLGANEPTDGNENTTSTTKEAMSIEPKAEATSEQVPDTEVEAQLSTHTELPEVEDLVGEQIEEVANPSENELILSAEDVATASSKAVDEIAANNAAESEDATVRHEIPMLDYETLSMETLVDELEKLTSTEKVMAVKDHVEEVKKSFLAKYHHFIDEKKAAFHAENPETLEDFHYQFPLKTRFDQIYSHYRDRKNKHFKSLQNNLEANLTNRLAIVEELKNLVNNSENIAASLKTLNDIRDRWKNAGAIPKDKYNHVWNNFHFHMENFYDFLHLDREARDIDFKHNLDLKLKIISRVEELVQETDINKAFRELQDLHKIWKEDIGPVSREHREQIWIKFSDLTKQMHDKREVLFEKLRAGDAENLEKKKAIITQIETLTQEKVASHGLWATQVEKVEALRNEFFSTGKVPNEVNEATWTAFKNAVRDFNTLKNSFYKDIKKDQNDNLSRKQALVAKAKELQESTDFIATTPIMKQIQEEWKTIGHVPRKFSDALWTEFRAACNHYFEQLKNQKNEEDSVEIEAFDKKKEYLESMKDFAMTGDHKTDLDAIKLHIEHWKGFGKVPFGRRHIEGKFNKILDGLFEKLSLSKKDTDMMRFSNRMEQLAGSDDARKLENEKVFLIRKIEEVKTEMNQLENNIQFFANTRNAKKENSIVLEVRKNIAKHQEEIDVLKEKLKTLRNIKQE
jgi:Domain of Unknown Function (DUF349)